MRSGLRRLGRADAEQDEGDRVEEERLERREDIEQPERARREERREHGHSEAHVVRVGRELRKHAALSVASTGTRVALGREDAERVGDDEDGGLCDDYRQRDGYQALSGGVNRRDRVEEHARESYHADVVTDARLRDWRHSASHLKNIADGLHGHHLDQLLAELLDLHAARRR